MAKVVCKYEGCNNLISYMDKADSPPDYCHLHKHIAAYEKTISKRSGQLPKPFSQVFSKDETVDLDKIRFSDQMFNQKKELLNDESKAVTDNKTIEEIKPEPEPIKKKMTRKSKRRKYTKYE